jgi:hypothetical protein
LIRDAKEGAMGSIRTWLVRVCVVASLLLLAATVTLWVRSYFVQDLFKRFVNSAVSSGPRSLEFRVHTETLQSYRGRWRLDVLDQTTFQTGTAEDAARLAIDWTEAWHVPAAAVSSSAPAWGTQSRWNGLGFYAKHEGVVMKNGVSRPLVFPVQNPDLKLVWYLAGTPFWIVAAGFAMPPAVWLAMMLRARNRKAGQLCVHCGYDIRATPHRCPECGRIPDTGESPLF